jgi:serine/threonine-protein kinase PpkA
MISPFINKVILRSMILIVCLTTASMAQARDPEKLDGTALDHRILSRPGAILFDAPGGQAKAAVPTFSSFYVFGKSNVEGVDWVEVGANRVDVQTGWLPAERTVDWKQTIVLSFTNPAGRLPSMFFATRAGLETFLQDEAMSTRAELLSQQFSAGQGAGDTDIVSMEPKEFISMSDQFYMLPILDHASIRVNRRPKRIVEIASINQKDPADASPAEDPAPFKVGIVFVIDTSTSMQDYIDATKTNIKTLLDNVKASGSTADFSFGIIGFRSSTDRVPGLEYTAREFYPLTPNFDEDAFLATFTDMNATQVSSHDFDEDGLSGMAAAAAMTQWDSFDGRYIIYVSDAGMLVGTDSGAASDATPEQVAVRLKEDLGIASFALFLKTRAGQAYHDDAISQLDTLTRQSATGQSGVFPIEDGDVGAFSAAVGQLTQALIKSVVAAASVSPPTNLCATDSTSIDCAAASAGYAMQLAWLGRQQQTQAPDTYQAWVADFALDDPRRIALAPRVLLTRAQLNDVYVTLQAIVEAFGQSEQARPEEFFVVLQSVLARVMRDPSALPALDAAQSTMAADVSEFEDLGDLLGPYLQDLPYDSDLGSLTQALWVDSGANGRHEYIEALKGKLSMYELYYADTESWIALNANSDAREYVYPLPLEMMP